MEASQEARGISPYSYQVASRRPTSFRGVPGGLRERPVKTERSGRNRLLGPGAPFAGLAILPPETGEQGQSLSRDRRGVEGQETGVSMEQAAPAEPALDTAVVPGADVEYTESSSEHACCLW